MRPACFLLDPGWSEFALRRNDLMRLGIGVIAYALAALVLMIGGFAGAHVWRVPTKA